MQKTADTAEVSFKRSCSRYGHAKVCTLLRAIAPLLGNWEEGQRPFEATDLASICFEYQSPEAAGTGNL